VYCTYRFNILNFIKISRARTISSLKMIFLTRGRLMQEHATAAPRPPTISESL
jgi:hypothetical protein